MKPQPDIRIGISGWTYPPWRGEFYPEDLQQRRELEYASRQVNSIEINGTFYSLQTPKSFSKWAESTPDDFKFAVKAPRYITHITRLDDPLKPVANFFASGLLNLGQKLGPILWQLPPSFRFDPERVGEFLKLLPHDTEAAEKLARNHDDKVKGRAVVSAPWQGKIRHAMEVRHASFECGEFISLLREHQVAVVVADTAGKWPVIEDVTSDFIYLRLHGDKKIYVSGYTDEAIGEWERKIRRWSEGGNPRDAGRITPATPVRKSGRDVHVYFDNDVKTRAPFDAMDLAARFGITPRPFE